MLTTHHLIDIDDTISAINNLDDPSEEQKAIKLTLATILAMHEQHRDMQEFATVVWYACRAVKKAIAAATS